MKHFGNVLLAALMVVGCAGGAAAEVWSVNRHTYVMVPLQGATWVQAQADLQARLGAGWYLATITSREENDFIFNTLVLPSGGSKYWLGGFQNPPDETAADLGWSWVTGEDFTLYRNWANAEPNDAAYGPGSEQWLEMLVYDNGTWNDAGVPEEGVTGYIAENDAPVSHFCNGGKFRPHGRRRAVHPAYRRGEHAR